MNRIDWLISDTHFGHDNIIRLANRPQDHDRIMVERWHETVREDETILHLGDVSYRGYWDYWAGVLETLPGQKYLMPGNHDHNLTLLNSLGFTVVEPFIREGVAFTHYPITDRYPAPEGEWHTNVHGHTHGNPPFDKDGVRLPGKRYVDISVETTDYRPVRYAEVVGT